MSGPSSSSSFVGVDIGRSKTVIIRQNGDLVLTETGGIVRASLVAFAGRARYVGEEAAQAQSGSASCVVVGGDVTAVSSSLARFVKAGLLQLDERGGVMATVQYCDDTATIPLVALLGMFLARQDARIREVTGDNKVRLAFVMPTDCSPALRAAVRAACHIARIEPGRVHLVDRVDALVSAYRRKQQVASSSSGSSGDEGRLVVLCDVGCEQSTLILLRESSSSIKALSHAQLPLGAAHFDSALFDHFSPSAGSPAPVSKRGGRLLGACERLRKLLSQLPSSSVVCENMNDSGADVNLSLSRADLASIAEPLLAALRAAVAAVLLSAGPGAFVEVVEMLGGGARMPCVQALVAAACPGAVLGWRFDDGSQALGAALFASASSSSSSSSTSSSSASGSASTASGGEGEGLGAPQDEIELLAQQEDEWQGRDREWCELLQCRNAIETAVLSLRSARSQHPGLAHLLPRELEAALDGFEDWLWSHPDASLAETTAHRTTMESELARLAGPFHQALEQERRKGGGAGKGDTKAGEEEAVAAGEKAGSSPNPPDRLRLTLKNLAEADDLLRGDVVTELQLRAALARFNKALSHCLSLPGTLPSSSSSSAAAVGSKRPAPPSPAPSADQQQAASLLERIHLGLATCHSKLKNIDLAIAACSAALSAAPSSVAALHSRSELYVAKKDWERATEDAAAAVAAIKRRGGSGDELAAAVLWAGKLSSRAREEEKAKKSAQSSCSVM